MSLSKKEVDELRPMIDRLVQKVVGYSESALVKAAITCLDKGYDEGKTADKMGSILEDSQARNFSEKLFSVYEEYRAMTRHDKTRKRKPHEEDIYDEQTGVPTGGEVKKKKRFQEDSPTVPDPGQPSPGQLTADKIKEMMFNAQKMIQERKAQLRKMDSGPNSGPPPPSPTQQQALMTEAMHKAKKAAELQARIQQQMANTGLMGLPALGNKPVAAPPVIQPATIKQATDKPTPLILDDQGRTIDISTGETIQLAQHMPTLKANIRAKKREQFKAVIQEKAPEEITDSKFFDNRLGGKGAIRSRRSFKFHEHGKFQQLASRLRTKALLEKLQGEISQAAKKTGIASAAKLATLQPKKPVGEDEIPEVEWWDSVILQRETYEQLEEDKIEGVTNLVEHPAQMKPPAQTDKVVQIPVMLTKKERKKLRRQTRGEAQKELQEKIRIGLMQPPEPKVRMSNLMRVLGTEAVQDPTKVEAHVRAQMAKRVKTHEDANAARKLSKEERREKKIDKIKEDTTLGVHVSVYRVRDLHDPASKFKVETNAKQLYMTGTVIIHRDCNVVVVEGGPRQQKKFRRLMLHRIKWNQDKKGKSKNEDGDSDDEEKKSNSCALVWEGTAKSRSFGEMKFKTCPTENFAREHFKKHSVQQYWDLAYSSSVMEAAGEEL